MQTQYKIIALASFFLFLALGVVRSENCLAVGDVPSSFLEDNEQVLSLELSQTERTWLKDHPLIKVGALTDWAPFDFSSSKGAQQGITVDYLKLIEKRLKIVFQISPQNKWAEMLLTVRNRKIDMVTSIVKTNDRSEYLNFTIPYFSCPYVTVTRRMDKQIIRGIQDLSSKKVAVERGFYLQNRIQNEYPNIELYPVDTTFQALKNVASEQVDAYIGNRAVVSWMIEQQQLSNLKIASYTHFAPTQLRLGVRKDWPELTVILNKAMGAITPEEHLEIQKKWLGAYDTDTRDIYQRITTTVAEQQWLETIGPLRLGIDLHWAPLEFMDNKGKHSGFSSDYIQRFTQQLGLDLAPVEKIPWVEVLQKARERKLDLVPMVVATKERSEYLSFTKPYLDFPLVVFTRRNSRLITGLKDISGRRLAVEKGFMTVEYLKDDYPDIELIEVPTTLDALKEVAYGRADAFVGNLVTGSYLINQEGLTNLKIAAPTPYRSLLCMGVRKDWPLMVTLLNRAIDSLTEEDKAAIRNNWMPIRYDQKVDYSLLWKVAAVAIVLVILLLYRHSDINRRNDELNASQAQFKELINTLPLTVVVISQRGKIVFDNPHAGHEFGEGKTLVGRSSKEFYADNEDRIRIIESLRLGVPVVGQHVKFNIDSGESVDSLVSAIPIRFDKQDALLAVAINVTERVKTEANLKRAKKRAEEADHLKSAFLASMSHELRTPLNSIIGFTGILLQELAGPLNEEQKKQLSMVQGSSRHLLSLINDVLDISKIEAGELKIALEEFDIKDCLEKVVQTLTPLAQEKNLELRLGFTNEIGLIRSDQRRVEQVFLNIIGNGLKFTDKGHVRVLCQRKNDMLVIAIEDTGPGIKSQDMGKLFKTFQQLDSGVDRIHEGTGLGLSISKKLVEKLGGELTAKSVWGEGSLFTIRLPFSHSSAK